MSAEQLVNRYARIYIDAASRHGHALDTIFRHSGIPPRRPSSGHFTLTELMKLSRGIKLLLQDEFFGHSQSGCKVGTYELMVELALSGPTLADALQKISRFYALLTADIQFSVTTESQSRISAIQVRTPHAEMDRHHFLCEWWLLNLWSLASWLVGEKIQCQQFDFLHSPEIDEAEYRQAFIAECRFSQPQARLLFNSDYLQRPVVKNALNIDEYFITSCDRFGAIPGASEAFAPRLKGILMAYFHRYREFPPLSYGAEQCHLPSHTLRRRLVEEGTSFTKIKDDIRKDTVLKLLRSSTMSLGEVTELGGFSDTSSLARAVKNWTGFYPGQYKERLRQRH